MEGLVLVLVPLLLLVGLGVVAAMVLDVAFLGGERVVTERDRFARRWRPPTIDGGQLLAWARENGARLAARLLDDARNESMPVAMSATVHDGATRAMLPMLPEREMSRRVPCPEGGQAAVGVTAPEAFEIADYVRCHLSDKERNAILRRTAMGGCALQGSDCTCLTYGARPLRCRPLHAGSVLGHQASTPWGSPSEEETRGARSARIVAEGVEQGLVRALDVAGLDGKVYDINSAVEAALRRPDAARRWLEGEDVFADCTPAPPSALSA